MSSLKNKIAVVTGGSSGIGLATAKRFVEEGAYVFIAGRRQAELDKAVAEIGKNVTGVKTDISKIDDLDRLYEIVLALGEARGDRILERRSIHEGEELLRRPDRKRRHRGAWSAPPSGAAEEAFAIASHGQAHPAGAGSGRSVGGGGRAEPVEQDVGEPGRRLRRDTMGSFDQPGVGHEDHDNVLGGEIGPQGLGGPCPLHQADQTIERFRAEPFNPRGARHVHGDQVGDPPVPGLHGGHSPHIGSETVPRVGVGQAGLDGGAVLGHPLGEDGRHQVLAGREAPVEGGVARPGPVGYLI